MGNQENTKLIGMGEGVKLPMGYRFLPSDAQLINYYLIPKILRRVLPADIIPPIDVFHTNPLDLLGDSKEKRYFFCTRERKMTSYKPVSGSGYWKATGKQVVISENEKEREGDSKKTIIGLKRKLTFCHRRQNLVTATASTTGTRTRKWVMWEYRLATSTNEANSNENVIEEVGDWMVCAITSDEKKIQPRNSAIRLENVWEGNVSNHLHHCFARIHPCYNQNRHKYGNILATENSNYETGLAYEESSSSSCSIMMQTTDEDFFSENEKNSTSSE